MKKDRVTRSMQFAFAATFALAIASRADAAAILQISNVHEAVDDVALTASVSASLDAQFEEVSLDGISVILTGFDLTAGPPFLDDSPFFLVGLPDYSLDAGESLPNALLFGFSGLTPGTSYSGFFYIQFNTTELTVRQPFGFATAAAVPEPATLLLMASGLGASGLLERRRRRQRKAS